MPNFVLVGEMASGKDTIADLMPGYQRVAFGDEVRLVAKNLRINGVEATYCQLCQLFEKKPPADLREKLTEFRAIPQLDAKDRRLLQDLGTYCRMHDDLIWIRPVLEKMSKDAKYVVTDCRRLAELEACKEFESIYIDTDEAVRVKRLIERDGGYNPANFHHPAEIEIRKLRFACDWQITNNGSIDSLKESIERILTFTEGKVK